MRKPRWKEVESSNLERIRYDRSNRILHITFRNQSHYIYYDVSYYRYLKLYHAESKGKYFNRFIRGHYDYVRVKEEE